MKYPFPKRIRELSGLQNSSMDVLHYLLLVDGKLVSKAHLPGSPRWCRTKADDYAVVAILAQAAACPEP